MFNFLRKKREVIAFPYNVESVTYRIVMYELMENRKLSAKDALRQIFSRGVEEMGKDIFLNYIKTSQKERKEQTEYAAEEILEGKPRRERRNPEYPRVSNAEITKGRIRFAFYEYNGRRAKQGRIKYHDSENFLKTGYKYYSIMKDGADTAVFLYKGWISGACLLQTKKSAKHDFFLLTEDIQKVEKHFGLSIEPGISTDVPFSIREGQGCLILTLKK